MRFSSVGKIFDSKKEYQFKAASNLLNEYKHCIKKLNTDVILNENIFLMKFINDIYHLLKGIREK